MTVGLKHLRLILALIAAVVLAAASLALPTTELAEELHHASIHEASGPEHASHAFAAVAGDPVDPDRHQHPDTLGHSHCAGCHLQFSEARPTFSLAHAFAELAFAAFSETIVPSGFLDGLFRPPRI
ncbi:MAG: DUF2946 family protein [Parvularculaceae bacterium]